MSSDPVFETFLQQQFQQGTALARQSDLVELIPLALDRYVAQYRCKGLVRGPSGEIVEASEFAVGIWFHADYLWEVRPAYLLTWLHPHEVWHPNIRSPGICIGHIAPGMEIADLLYQCFEIITYHNWSAHDPLNPDAAQWARNNQSRFPIDERPLKRRAIDLEVGELEQPS
jgi:ubiquitin-protein ligase